MILGSLIGSKTLNRSTIKSLILIPVRNAAGKWRQDNGLPPRFASGTVLTESPEWSYVDGRGFGPLNKSQKSRYYRDACWTNEVVKITNDMKLAKKLVSDDIEKPQLKFREKFRGMDNMP